MKALSIRLPDKFVLFSCCTAMYFATPGFHRDVAPLLAAVAFASLLSYFEQEAATLVLTALFLMWSAFVPPFAAFLPLVLYDALFARCRPVCFFALVPLAFFFRAASTDTAAFLCVLLMLGAWLRYRADSLEKLKAERNDLSDSARELSMKLERQNRELLEKQDAEISAAALKERGRIAREIHDSVGHLLSSALLQVGALLAVNRDEAARSGLSTLRNTLNEAMDSIRRSVHDLHDESIDLYAQMYQLVQSFSFCPLIFRYELENDPPAKMKYTFLAIVKEGLSNIMRHSRATCASVLLREHPGFYQLIITNNGCTERADAGDGIGLQNIRDRVESFHGVMNVTAGGDDFRIFISMPKGAQKR